MLISNFIILSDNEIKSLIGDQRCSIYENDPFFVNECGFFIQRFYEVREKVTPKNILDKIKQKTK